MKETAMHTVPIDWATKKRRNYSSESQLPENTENTLKQKIPCSISGQEM